ncbi:hypothetical protein OG895_06795 [Streptomyces sp. NBC_00201]|uniref:hypothetical protein n=1 Tax=unclassified Streptomyces TaxID=2593676 RepID=UPI00224CA197|nr:MULTISPECIES: hypothetical protein [unclassified Streptomyces]MCX5244956.1 hypothetical protein [Streptomyces sp. NBC_00201]MCX5289312.1 hypothetical protein [Streptomyces sp. NBC_00183]
MKRPGPLITLLVGLLLGLFMLSLNATTGTKTVSSTPKKESPPVTASPAPTKTSASPSPSPSPSRVPVPDASYAGRTDDDSSAVAVTVRDRKAIAYFCDGHSKESWLKGDVKDDGSMRLTGRNGDELNGTLQQGKRIHGSVDVGGGHYAFTADEAKKPSGLYRATTTVRGARLDGGWIVLPGGKQVGIVTRDSRASAAPAIDPETGAVTVDGQQLTARPATP